MKKTILILSILAVSNLMAQQCCDHVCILSDWQHSGLTIPIKAGSYKVASFYTHPEDLNLTYNYRLVNLETQKVYLSTLKSRSYQFIPSGFYRLEFLE